ncbi:MAG: B12-binding domain-containing radical SAM protein [Magnetococcales bacterium]|nr:B12-binding domain-containing radical SAM protein [Magnetococcales bacterium]
MSVPLHDPEAGVPVCLIRPPSQFPGSNMVALLIPPLGLAYVGGALAAAGVGFAVIDSVGEAPDERRPYDNDTNLFGLALETVVDRIPQGVKIIGVSSSFSFDWPLCRTLVGMIRRRFPQALLVAGGEHVTALPEESLRTSELDMLVLGEGEATFVELVERYLAGDRELAGIAGTLKKGPGGELVSTQRRLRLRQLDQLPRPAWDRFPLRAYLDRNLTYGVFRGRSMPILGSRGCPYQCAFCSSENMWTTRWEPRSPKDLLREIRDYQEEYDIQNFDFYDLTAIIKKRWILEFCQEILDSGLKFTWQLPTGTRVEAFDAEVAAKLFASGCRNLAFSPESGSQRVLDRIMKRVDIEHLLQAIRDCEKIGINTKGNLVIGFPEESRAEIRETIRYGLRMALAGAHDLTYWAFTPYPGSRLFRELREQGLVTPDDAYFDSLRSYADTQSTRSLNGKIGDRELRFYRRLGTLLFYLASWATHPSRPFRMVWNIVSGREESRSEMVIRRRLGLLGGGRQANRT